MLLLHNEIRSYLNKYCWQILKHESRYINIYNNIHFTKLTVQIIAKRPWRLRRWPAQYQEELISWKLESKYVLQKVLPLECQIVSCVTERALCDNPGWKAKIGPRLGSEPQTLGSTASALANWAKGIYPRAWPGGKNPYLYRTDVTT